MHIGALRNISSAGEAARKFLRSAHGLVDTLVWIVRAASGQDVDEKVSMQLTTCTCTCKLHVHVYMYISLLTTGKYERI